MSKKATFTFGRFQPATIGHSALINKVVGMSKGGDYFIFTSQTKDNDTNPLDYGTKIGFLRLLFPIHADHIIQDPKIKNVLNAADYIEARGYTDVIFVCGSDRISEFTNLLNKWNQIHRGMGKGFNTLNIVSSGDREDGADGIAGVSASMARKYAKEGNFNAFKGIIPNDEKLAMEIYTSLRKELGLNEIKRCIKNIIIKMLCEVGEFRPEDADKIKLAKRRTALLKVKEEDEIRKSAERDLVAKQNAYKNALKDTSPEADVKLKIAKDNKANAAQNLLNLKKRVTAAKNIASSIK